MGKNKKLAIDKEQSEWVERIFKWYSEGLSPMRIKRIAKDLHIGVGTVYKVLDKGA